MRHSVVKVMVPNDSARGSLTYETGARGHPPERHSLLGRPTCLSADLCFTTDSFFFFFFIIRRPLSALAEQNSTKTGHMFGSECDLKMHVRNLGYSIPYKSRAQKPPFQTTSQLNGKFNGLYLRNKTRHKQAGKCFGNWEGPPTSPQNNMNFGPQKASNWM